MLKRISYPAIITIIFISSFALVLSGCNRSTSTPPAPTQPPDVSPTVTATSEPVAPSDILLAVDPANLMSEDVRQYLASFAAENGLEFQALTSPELPAQDEHTKVVFFLAEPANLSDIVTASPSTQFIVAGDIEGLSMPNLSLIRTAGEDLAFMAGYLTMQIAWDWRAAALIPTDTVMGAEKADAFENGARYLCGQCTPYYAPLVYFPLLAQEPMQAGYEAWDAQIVNLAQHYVNSYYLDPSISTPEILDRLIGLEDDIYNDVNLIGLRVAADDRYTALIDFDILPALQQLMPQSLNGTGGQVVNGLARIMVNNNDQVVTIAKMDNFNRVAADLAAGIIIPLSIP